MSATEDVQRIIAIAANLDPRAVRAEVDRMTASRIQAWRPNPGRHAQAVDSPGLFSDATDQWYAKKLAAYDNQIASALRSLEQAVVGQRQIIDGRGNTDAMHDASAHDGTAGAPTQDALDAAEDDVSPSSGTCANCARVVERTPSDRLLSGRCRNCYEYRRRHGVERPRHLWEVETG